MTNAQRIARVKALLAHELTENTEAEAVTDLIADVMHYCLAHDIDFSEAHTHALYHVKWELAEATQEAAQ